MGNRETLLVWLLTQNRKIPILEFHLILGVYKGRETR